MLLLALVGCFLFVWGDRYPPDAEDCCFDTGPSGPPWSLPTAFDWESAERPYSTGIGWGDVDFDGRDELVVASGNDMSPGRIAVYDRDRASPSDLDPEPVRETADAHYFGHLAVGDVDGDGFDDVVVSRVLGDDDVPDDVGGVMLFRGGADDLEATPSWRADGFHSFACALGDVDGDGDLDLAVATGEPYSGAGDVDRVYENVDGHFADVPMWTSEDVAVSLDVAFVGGMWVFARAGSPHAAYTGLSTTPTWVAPGDVFAGNSVDAGDVDGDGAADLLISGNDYGHGRDDRLTVYCSPDWTPCWTADEDRPWSAVSIHDVDGDGAPDMVAGSWYGPVEAWSWATRDDGPVYVSDTTSVIEGFAWRLDDDDPHEALAVSNWDPDQGSYVFGER